MLTVTEMQARWDNLESRITHAAQQLAIFREAVSEESEGVQKELHKALIMDIEDRLESLRQAQSDVEDWLMDALAPGWTST